MADPWTPGPWKATKRANNMIDVIHSRPFEKGAITLALCRVQARDTWVDEATANARLIASSPELVEAIDNILSNFPRFNPDHYPVIGDDIRTSRALLARIRNGGTD
jgi:antitoxin component HigA of HigAB toxin-antitoxin module